MCVYICMSVCVCAQVEDILFTGWLRTACMNVHVVFRIGTTEQLFKCFVH